MKTLLRIGWVLALTMATLSCSSGAPIVASDASTMDSPAVCTSPQTACNGHCTDLQTDTNNCGACGTPCGSGMICTAGACALGCPGTETACSGLCVTLMTDGNNCGTCGHACAVGQVCSAGVCGTTCASPLMLCAGGGDASAVDGGSAGAYCANLTSDRANCGACGNACPTGNICTNSACQVSCPMEQSVCSGTCTDLMTDTSNCGMCGTTCPTGEACVAGTCSLVCATGLTACATACTNVQTDNANCGACGTICPAGQVCSRGSCGTTCGAPLSTCGSGSGTYCANTGVDPANCGTCGTVCALPNVTTEGCNMGACAVVTCATGFGDCDGVASNGCETNTLSSAANCGACGRACALSNATANCAAGACAVTLCSAGFADCNHLASDGCEVNTQTDNGNCGACGTTCPTGQVCSGGVCGTTCAMPLATCGTGSSATCTNTANDPSNCGGCGTVCSLANTASDGCGAGACTIVRCATGFGDCDGLASDGCEVNTQTSNANCGACGRACALANATAACTAGACAITTCGTGFADCDMSATDGCEVNTHTDNANCGACGVGCPAGQVCSGGTCGATCASPLTSCGTGAAAFCANTQIDPLNCGHCGTVCSLANTAADGCASGACTVVRCATGFGDCNGIASDGCEVNTATTTNNCGVCGHACMLANATSTCAVGVCAIAACSTGYADCDHSAADGCEVNTQSDNTNCGGCGITCGAGTVCSGGVCSVTCSTGLTNCTGICVNEHTDNANCGACAHACGAGTSCAAGVCTVTCSTGLTNCTGTCINELTDNANCGACAHACGAGTMCSAGSCSTTCGTGLTNCSSQCVDLTSSTANCGSCGRVCTTGQVCFEGTCTLLCGTGETNCGTSCATLSTDPLNCGACGHACGAGQTCSGGECGGSNCYTLHTATPSLVSGIYTIDPDGSGPLPAVSVYCDMTTNGGGWTLVQRTVINWSMTSLLLTNYATMRSTTMGSPSPGSYYRLAGMNWPAIQTTNDHLTVQVPLRDDGTSCLPMYYIATGGVWNFPTSGPANLAGTISQNVTIFNATTLSTTDTGPSSDCVTTYNGAPWTYTDCCTTCPSFLGSYWDGVAGAEHPMSSYLATVADLNGNLLSNVCVGDSSSPSLSLGYYGEASMEYYLR